MPQLESAGAADSVRFHAPDGLVVEAAADAAGGEVTFSFPLADRPPPHADLSPVEWEILRAISLGSSNHAIAARRGVKVRTVANQVARLFRKLGVHSRLDAALVAGHWSPPASRD